MRRIYRKISCLITNQGIVAAQGRQPREEHLGLIADAALVYDSKKGVLWAGADNELPKEFKSKGFKHIDASGHVAYPGLVDAHTHLVFAGDRSREFELRMRGASYQEIAAAGGGILYSMAATRAASAAELKGLALERLRVAYSFGVRLLEAKSGYGLNLDSERKILQAGQAAVEEFPKISIESTCMAAHAIPPEYRDARADYIDLICRDILPKTFKHARYCDAFCDQGFFTLQETETIFRAAKTLGYELRLHADELAPLGATELGVSLGVHSVDHLLKITDKGIKALADSNTVGILLPATSLYLREPAAPARKLIDAGALVAIATDFNPGTSPTQNLPLVGTLAALHLGMSTAEIIAALTWVPAFSLRREKEFGALLPGFKGEPIFCRGDHPSALFYQMAPAALPLL